MEPRYMNEIRYSYLVGSYRRPFTDNYEAQSPETSFEYTVQSLFLEGQSHLHHEEYNLALGSFRELMALILRTVHPRMPLDPNSHPIFDFPMDPSILDVLAGRAAATLKATPLITHAFPSTVVSARTELPGEVERALAAGAQSGVQVTSFHRVVAEQVGTALIEASKENWSLALEGFQAAVAAVPDSEPLVRGSLMHDMAVLAEKAGDKPAAERFGTESVALMSATGQLDVQVQVLDSVTGILQRAGQVEEATRLSAQANSIRATNNVNPVVAAGTGVLNVNNFALEAALGSGRTHLFTSVAALRPGIASGLSASTVAARGGTLTASEGTAASLARGAAIGDSANVEAPALMGLRFLDDADVAGKVTKTFTMQGATATASIVLDGNDRSNARAFLQTVSATSDVALVTRFLFDAVQMVAYLPHMYFFVVPMSIGDCLAGMGNLEQAATQYRSVLSYPFINRNLESVRLWTRLAQVYLDSGDTAYRNAKDDPALYANARTFYEHIVFADKTVPTGSPLYSDDSFSGVRTRVQDFLQASDFVAHDENPTITTIVLQALTRLQQIDQGLNFFAFGPDYAPPFSFEYLQNTARYFAQQASQIEQRFIQFKSQAENEQLRRDQLEQQAEVARQSVVLEQRGVAEAQRGVDVAVASQAYAQRQLDNTRQAKEDFENNRWELLELAEAEAWASASAVDRDDQVKLTWNGSYYSSNRKPRNQVLQDLAYQRGRLSQDLEAAKLNREIAAAQSYRAVAQAQVAQSQARVDMARQRVVVAQLQQKHSEQNRDFLDMREFGSQLWYDLAQQARRLKQRYLDMATEIAFLMERAYNAETERGLSVVRYDYQHTSSGNLMGADMLAVDIDYFTFDYLTTTKTKKLPVKKSISLADAYPMQFQSLKATGTCLFETALEDFDREHPGLYLAKVSNVELLFVGITQATSIAGSLRNIGVSRFRNSAGAVVPRLYPSDVMALSQYDIRQDALVFRSSPNDLRVFENSGIATSWQLDLPPSANDFDYRDILDVRLVLYYDGFFDPVLENQVKATLPATGSASRAFSMRMSFPDELFYLRNQGEAELAFDATMFPQNQKTLTRTAATLKVTGATAATAGLTVRLAASSLGPTTITLTTNADGEVSDAAADSPLRALRDKPMVDTFTLQITAADNPQLVEGGVLDLSGIEDVLLFAEYGFTYR